jgi:hypothetical protein
MKKFVIGLGVLVACDSAGERATSKPAEQLQRQKPLEILAVTRAEWTGWGKGVQINYQTTRQITDIAALREEADSLWTVLRPHLEADGYCTVELKASEPRRTLQVPGTKSEIRARRIHSFFLRHDSAGAWRWLQSTEPPSRPCVATPEA